MARSELGESATDEDDDVWMVASPWRSVSVRDVVAVLVREHEREQVRADEGAWQRIAERVFSWDESQLREQVR
jgi:hypothetical protein